MNGRLLDALANPSWQFNTTSESNLTSCKAYHIDCPIGFQPIHCNLGLENEMEPPSGYDTHLRDKGNRYKVKEKIKVIV